VTSGRLITLLVGLGLWMLALASYTAVIFDDDAGERPIEFVLLLAGPPVGGILIGAATIGRHAFVIGAVLLLTLGVLLVAALTESENAEAIVLLVVVTFPSAVIGVVLGLAGAWLVRRTRPT
jgi:uncharacterized membrane protein